MKEIKIEMSAYVGFVPGIRTAIGRIAYNFGFNDKETYEIETVVDEICNNAIEHGSRGDEKSITVTCKFDNKVADITVKDSGSPDFDVDEVLKEGKRLMEEEAKKSELDTVRRKRGLIIVQKYVDTLNIKSNNDGTVVRMIKKSHKKRG